MKAILKLESKKPFIVMQLEDYESIMETLDIVSSNPKIKNELDKEEKKYLKGNFFIYNPKTGRTHRNRPLNKKKKVV